MHSPQSLSEFIQELERHQRTGIPFQRIAIQPLPIAGTPKVRYIAFAHGADDAVVATREFLEIVDTRKWGTGLSDEDMQTCLSSYARSQARTLYFRRFLTELV